ncbi:MAG: GAF domain-containing protein, partial [Burkholderiaceae bacterium]|nr:GAF domain-containing protein [Burkholderiaceae bacterium]
MRVRWRALLRNALGSRRQRGYCKSLRCSSLGHSCAGGGFFQCPRLIDADRQWFKASIGLPGVTETPRELAFCAHAILESEILEVPDATLDPRFRENGLVVGEPGIRFYAGASLQLSDGTHAGTLCVIDRQPRRLDAKQ